jgi:GNAT superfamily N-acetyltransferase
MLLRPAEPQDAMAVARVHVRSWQAAYRTLLPDDYLNQLRPEDRAHSYDFASLDPLKPRTIVAVEPGFPATQYSATATCAAFSKESPMKFGDATDLDRKSGVEGLIHGFVTTAPSRDLDLPDHGELWALYVDPELWGRGIGVALVSAARASLVELGVRKAFLWALAGNVRADRFYQMDGWAPDGVSRSESMFGVTVNEVRYQRGLAAP